MFRGLYVWEVIVFYVIWVAGEILECGVRKGSVFKFRGYFLGIFSLLVECKRGLLCRVLFVFSLRVLWVWFDFRGMFLRGLWACEVYVVEGFFYF